jgi:hypothetical protein
MLGYLQNNAGSTNRVFGLFQKNGIVYTRAKIDGFQEGPPPNTVPPSAGNQKVINNVVFLRGQITPDLLKLTKAELHLGTMYAQTIEPTGKRLGHKSAAAGLAEACPANLWTFLPDVPWAAPLIWNTVQLNDGDYDLIIQAKNTREWWDNFDPDFAGDADAARDSDEKWLKHQGTWFNQDRDPNNDDEGKVILDNTPPAVGNHKPQ